MRYTSEKIGFYWAIYIYIYICVCVCVCVCMHVYMYMSSVVWLELDRYHSANYSVVGGNNFNDRPTSCVLSGSVQIQWWLAYERVEISFFWTNIIPLYSTWVPAAGSECCRQFVVFLRWHVAEVTIDQRMIVTSSAATSRGRSTGRNAIHISPASVAAAAVEEIEVSQRQQDYYYWCKL